MGKSRVFGWDVPWNQSKLSFDSKQIVWTLNILVWVGFVFEGVEG